MPIEDNELIVISEVEVGVVHHHVLVEIEEIDHSNRILDNYNKGHM